MSRGRSSAFRARDAGAPGKEIKGVSAPKPGVSREAARERAKALPESARALARAEARRIAAAFECGQATAQDVAQAVERAMRVDGYAPSVASARCDETALRQVARADLARAVGWRIVQRRGRQLRSLIRVTGRARKGAWSAHAGHRVARARVVPMADRAVGTAIRRGFEASAVQFGSGLARRIARRDRREAVAASAAAHMGHEAYERATATALAREAAAKAVRASALRARLRAEQAASGGLFAHISASRWHARVQTAWADWTKQAQR